MSIGSGIAICGVWVACAVICAIDPIVSILALMGAVIATGVIAGMD